MIKIIISCCLFCIASYCSAALFDRGNGLIYDDHLNITWTQSGNLAASPESDGRMTWSAAKSWVTDFEYGGFSDWRLPSARLREGFENCSSFDGSCDQGYSNTHSELGHMFYSNLGNRGLYTTEGVIRSGGFGVTNSIYRDADGSIAFTDLQSWIYWFQDESSIESESAWVVGFLSGQQYQLNKATPAYVWAVRDGDVVAPVPLPAGVWLFSAALMSMLMARRRVSVLRHEAIRLVN